MALIDATTALAKAGIPHWLTYGALLGLVREGRLMPYDVDIDFAIAPGVPMERVIDALAGAGFEMVMSGRIGDRYGNHMFERRRISIDVYPLIVDGQIYRDHGVVDDYTATSCTHPIMDIGKLAWSGHDIPVPADPETYLAHLYGAEWRVPVPKWHWMFAPPNGTINVHWRSIVRVTYIWLRTWAFRRRV